VCVVAPWCRRLTRPWSTGVKLQPSHPSLCLSLSFSLSLSLSLPPSLHRRKYEMYSTLPSASHVWVPAHDLGHHEAEPLQLGVHLLAPLPQPLRQAHEGQRTPEPQLRVTLPCQLRRLPTPQEQEDGVVENRTHRNKNRQAGGQAGRRTATQGQAEGGERDRERRTDRQRVRSYLLSNTITEIFKECFP